MAPQNGKNGCWVRRRGWNISSLRESQPTRAVRSTTYMRLTRRYDNGINTFDTANIYSNGESERILGKALREYNIPRENVVIMTKVRVPSRQGVLPSAHGEPDRCSLWFGMMMGRLSWKDRMKLVTSTAMDSPAR